MSRRCGLRLVTGRVVDEMPEELAGGEAVEAPEEHVGHEPVTLRVKTTDAEGDQPPCLAVTPAATPSR